MKKRTVPKTAKSNVSMDQPTLRPLNPCFSSGPTSKFPGWSLDQLQGALLGRSHRAGPAKEKLKAVIEKSRKILGIPKDYLIGIVPASDTGAFELAMWNLLGARGVDVVSFDSFGAGWKSDIKNELQISDCREFEADYGELPDLSATSKDRDIVFTWNGTTSGVKVPDASWIADDREGLTMCDATSAVFAMEVEWSKIDVATWSWQKVLGGEAQHGMLVLSPRAIERLLTYKPAWPLPKIFRLTKKGQLIKGVFTGETINTPSMLAVEDALCALEWAADQGGLEGLIARSNANLEAVSNWVEQSEWCGFLANRPEIRSNTSICLKITDPDIEDQADFIAKLTKILSDEVIAFDIKSYRDAPPGLRIWGGATIDRSDIEALLEWMDWAHHTIKAG